MVGVCHDAWIPCLELSPTWFLNNTCNGNINKHNWNNDNSNNVITRQCKSNNVITFLINSFNLSALSIKVMTQSSMPLCLSEQWYSWKRFCFRTCFGTYCLFINPVYCSLDIWDSIKYTAKYTEILSNINFWVAVILFVDFMYLT